ncbi:MULTISPECIES: HlyD family type I secretion periplasmic adaptor subunit [Rhizobium]|uniref:Membrane fusion protein (MFP) family protein n=1 Tax=Rhizobium leguminosarum bv. trifolii (strain WSM1325) TaxID=395491 RepID=C6ATY2_RHILS|nr:HlyD family type I secretion periplasmic adaptor subunit [Rhizobium leguminosarum]ACS57474.1 type I secretion membrane fusion protein, HlyD family [Rhizobium leguminosarum bv. trifolii WSM1325]MBY2905766.1 HlyD family type I secretion periplasmic adaptor subunit [Rhizobium leguminosarum]MBY2912784.1 HlyD family type I secretion periplasmic adaptor subunit [Rhizobium leguminosarum]MBY2926144.1 HlyD family type I secretion periplasmic adaptor subunit [Rhizobium leguminosarum]MBY2931496.1 HlyD
MNKVISESKRSLNRHVAVVGVLSIALVCGIGGWAATTELSSAVIGEGVIVVDGDVKKVQHLTGGIVSELLVSENDHVTAGQVLIRLDGTTTRANLSIVESTLAQLYARRARLKAERIGADSFEVEENISDLTSSTSAAKLLDGEQKLFDSRRTALIGMKSQLASRKDQLGEQVKGLVVQINATNDALGLIEQELEGIDTLYKKGLVTLQRLNTLKRARADLQGNSGQEIAAKAEAEGKAIEIDRQSIQLDEDRRSEIAKDLTDVEAQIAEYEERRGTALDQLHRLDITAPLTGRVHELSVHTVNGVIDPGQTLMLVVPENNELMVEAKVATRDIDQVHVGQSVDVRFSAFDQRTTPDVSGEITSIAPDIVKDERTGISYYPLRVKPKAESIARMKTIKLYPGMPAEVFIKIGDRTVISYLTKPLTDQMQHVFRQE